MSRTACTTLLALATLLCAFPSASAQTWSQDGPAPRNHTAAIYDVSTDQLVAFGGVQNGTAGALNDVWSEQQIVADGQLSNPTMNWVQVSPTGTAPSARFGHSAVYDSTSNRMIVFGGGSSPTSCLSDSWLLEDANSTQGTPAWVSLAPTSTPPARMNHVAAYNASQNVMIVFGGNNCAGGYLSDVWVLSNANGNGGTPMWTQLSPTGSGPTARENASAVYDSTNNVLTIYAGDSGGAGFSDVWTLSNADGSGGTPAWTQLAPTGKAPSARTGQSSVYDPVNNRMIMFGGVSSVNDVGTGFFGDTWILTYSNGIGGTPAWTQEKVTGTAPLRRFHTAAYNSGYNCMIVFGGESQITQTPADDHVFILTVANGLN